MYLNNKHKVLSLIDYDKEIYINDLIIKSELDKKEVELILIELMKVADIYEYKAGYFKRL